jgi:biotin carboxyl carrier protein
VLFEAVVGDRVVRVEVKGHRDRYRVALDGRSFIVDWHEGQDFSSLIVDGRSFEVGLSPCAGGYTVQLSRRAFQIALAEGSTGPAGGRAAASGPARLSAPMPGRIVRVLVVPGQEVTAGQGVVVMEAMKMENELRSPRTGRVRELAVSEGQAVESGTLLLVVE